MISFSFFTSKIWGEFDINLPTNLYDKLKHYFSCKHTLAREQASMVNGFNNNCEFKFLFAITNNCQSWRIILNICLKCVSVIFVIWSEYSRGLYFSCMQLQISKKFPLSPLLTLILLSSLFFITNVIGVFVWTCQCNFFQPFYSNFPYLVTLSTSCSFLNHFL